MGRNGKMKNSMKKYIHFIFLGLTGTGIVALTGCSSLSGGAPKSAHH
jgi:hypothetical protein